MIYIYIYYEISCRLEHAWPVVQVPLESVSAFLQLSMVPHLARVADIALLGIFSDIRGRLQNSAERDSAVTLLA